MKRQSIAIFVGCALLGGVGAFAGNADAWFVRHHSGVCYNDTSNFNLRDQDFGIKNTYNVNGNFSNLICPVPDTDTTSKGSIVNANVEAWVANAANPLTAKACFSTWNGQTGSCSVAVGSSPGGTGHQTVFLGGQRAFWQTNGGADFGYSLVTVGGGTRIAGLFYSN